MNTQRSDQTGRHSPRPNVPGRIWIWAAALIVCTLIVSHALADGVIIPDPIVPLAIKNHMVTVSIDNQVATTHVDQTFLNESDIGPVEGTYIFPLP